MQGPTKSRLTMAVIVKRVQKTLYCIPIVSRFITRHFHRVFFYSRETWQQTFWLGTPLLKCPLDLWIYQEIIHEVRPDIIIESGTYCGGSALFCACICDLIGHGRVVTIDPCEYGPRPTHERITYLRGSSVSEETLRIVHQLVENDMRVMVILDSDHAAPHFLSELKAYSDFVSAGSYLIVEDTSVNGHPVMPQRGPGPMEAVQEFLRENGTFVPDRSREKYKVTFNPSGYLKKTGSAQIPPLVEVRSK